MASISIPSRGPDSVNVVPARALGQSDGTSDDWLRRADAPLYEAKRKGRNRVEVDQSLVISTTH